jgi:hypothetical protein
MNTYPPLSLREHIDNLLSHLRMYFPDLETESLLFFDQASCVVLDEGQFIKEDDLMSYDKFGVFFERLCFEGREWINLSGDSWFKDKFLVSVEYSQRVGYSMTAIVLGGPSLDIGKKPLKQTRLKVI